MRTDTPESIVRIESIKFSFLGFIFACLVFSLFGGFGGIGGFLGNFSEEFLMALVGLYLSIWIIGGIVGRLIFRKRLNIFIGAILVTFLSLSIGVLFGSQVSYFNEGISQINGFSDYIIKPLAAVLFFGGIPTLIVAILLGVRIENKFIKVFQQK